MKYRVTLQELAARAAAATIAGSITAVGVGLTAWARLGLPGGPGLLAYPIGVALLIGLVYGPTAVSTGHPWWFALALAVKAVLFGELGFIVPSGVHAASSAPGLLELILGAALVVPFGLLLMLPVTIPVALITTGVLRHAARSSRAIAFALTGGVALGSWAIAVTLASAMPIDLSAVAEPVTLAWTVENHSTRDVTLGIWTGDPSQLNAPDASWAGTGAQAEACFVTMGHEPEASGWFVSLDDTALDLGADPRPSPLIVAAQAPGAHPSIRVVVGADGSVSALPMSPVPTEQELTANLCRGPLP